MKKPLKDYTKEELDKLMEKKWRKLAAKHDRYGMNWLIDMHNLLDWYEDKLKIIN